MKLENKPCKLRFEKNSFSYRKYVFKTQNLKSKLANSGEIIAKIKIQLIKCAYKISN